ncbi:Hypp810 [Branchiostoma lanceolatum]|uniref:Hypp810 protein n=1 Tax=Branchiostoma lanceolatum TaxID=7740 RepID=A0A8J9YQJ0_BRALA|nr:Hypp810 [Branchiostoma lanceolatum]
MSYPGAGYPPGGGAGYPPPGGPGYPPAGGAGYPPSGGAGFPGAFPPQPNAGQQQPPPMGFSAPATGAPGYPPMPGGGYPPAGPTGYPGAPGGFPGAGPQPPGGPGYPGAGPTQPPGAPGYPGYGAPSYPGGAPGYHGGYPGGAPTPSPETYGLPPDFYGPDPPMDYGDDIPTIMQRASPEEQQTLGKLMDLNNVLERADRGEQHQYYQQGKRGRYHDQEYDDPHGITDRLTDLATPQNINTLRKYGLLKKLGPLGLVMGSMAYGGGGKHQGKHGHHGGHGNQERTTFP